MQLNLHQLTTSNKFQRIIHVTKGKGNNIHVHCKSDRIESRDTDNSMPPHGRLFLEKRNNTGSQLKKRNSTGSRSLHIMNDCSSEENYFSQTYQKKVTMNNRILGS